MAHDAREWRTWGQGFPKEQAQYVALDVTRRPPKRIVLPPDGAHDPLPDDLDTLAVHLRTRRGDFHCLVPTCGPFSSAAAYQERRHHFRHKSARQRELPGHDPESLHHSNAKHELASWLEQQLGSRLTILFCDEHQVWTSEGTFEPDVYAEAEGGVRIAVEYQHSPGDPVTVLRKQRGYARAGITCWWVFGPYRQTCQIEVAETRYLRVAPTTVQHDLAREGVAYFWFDVEQRLMATPFNPGRSRIFPRTGEAWDEPDPRTERSYAQRPWPKGRFVRMEPGPLDSCWVDPATGWLVTPTSRRVQKEEARLDAEVAELRAQARHRYEEALIVVPALPTSAGEAEAVPEERAPVAPPSSPTPPIAPNPPTPPSPAADAVAPAPRLPWWRRWFRLGPGRPR